MKRREFIAGLGGAAVWPVVAGAQQPATPVIGFMSARSSEDSAHLISAFRQGLAEVGFIEGQNVVIEFRWAGGQYDRLPALAADLVDHRVSVLVAVGGDPSAVAAKHATSTIPIVFGMGGDPIKAGLVESFSRPGGNMTGFSILASQLEPKRLGLLHEVQPNIPLFGALLNPNFPPAIRQLQELEEAANTIQQKLVVSKASTDGELDASFASLIQAHVGGLIVASDPYFDTRRDRIITFAAQQRLPAIYDFREYAIAGGLMSYGVSLAEAYRQFGVYAASILKGAKPGDLPVQQAVKFELVINLKTARALGIEFPATFSAQANEAIE